MKPSFLIIILTALLAYNTYYDNYLIKHLQLIKNIIKWLVLLF